MNIQFQDRARWLVVSMSVSDFRGLNSYPGLFCVEVASSSHEAVRFPMLSWLLPTGHKHACICLSESLYEVGLLYSWNLASFSFQQRINIRRENLVNAKSFNWGDVCAPSSGHISVHFIEYIELICSQGGFDPLTCWFWNVLRNQPEIPGEKTCKLQTGRSETVRQLVITTRLSCCLYSELQYCADYSSSVLL